MTTSSATCSMAFCGSHPPDCSWDRQGSEIPAEAWRPSGYFAIRSFAQARLSAVKAKRSGWFSARRRVAMAISALAHSGRCEREPTLLMQRPPSSSVHLPEHDVERAEHGRNVGEHMAATDEIHGLQMGESGCADLAFVGLVGAVGDQIDAKLAL